MPSAVSTFCSKSFTALLSTSLNESGKLSLLKSPKLPRFHIPQDSRFSEAAACAAFRLMI